MSYVSAGTPKVIRRKFSHEVQGVVRVEERLADGLLVRVRRDRRHLRQQPDRGDLDLLRVERVQRVLVEGRQRRHRAGQHRHRVGVAREAVEEPPQVLVQHRVLADARSKSCELVRRGQLAVDQQVGDLQERRRRGQLLDRVPAVAQDADVAVDVRDRRAARRGVDEPVVEGDVAGLLDQRGRRRSRTRPRWRARSTAAARRRGSAASTSDTFGSLHRGPARPGAGHGTQAPARWRDAPAPPGVTALSARQPHGCGHRPARRWR